MTRINMPQDRPLISVIIPCYNCSKYIAEAIDSVLAQEYSPLEVIVVDDSSTDDSREKVKKYSAPVKLITQENAGPAAARNRGIREAKGEFFAFLDGDDAWLPNKLNLQLNFLLQHEEYDICCTDFRFWHALGNTQYPPAQNYIENGPDDSIDEELTGWVYHKQLLENQYHIISALLRRKLMQELDGFDESLITGEDYDFLIRASRITQFAKLKKPYALYRMNPASTTNIPRESNNELKVLKNSIEKFGYASPNGATSPEEALQARFFQLNFDHGYMHFWQGSACVAKMSFQNAYQYATTKFKISIYLFLSKLRCFWQKK